VVAGPALRLSGPVIGGEQVLTAPAPLVEDAQTAHCLSPVSLTGHGVIGAALHISLPQRRRLRSQQPTPVGAGGTPGMPASWYTGTGPVLLGRYPDLTAFGLRVP
jgi:hypothetical protein